MAEQQQAALGKILDQVVDELYILDAESFRFRFVSKGASDRLGYSREELLQMTPASIQPAISGNKLLELFAQLSSGGQQEMAIETIHQCKDGSSYPVKMRIQPTSYMNQQAFVAVATDITEERRIAEEAKQNQHFIESITDTSPELLYVFDLQKNNYIYFSRHIKNMLGYKVEDVLSGKVKIFSLLHPEDYQKVASNFLKKIHQLRDDEVIETVYRVQHRDGHWVWLSSRDKPFRRNRQGEVVQTVGTAQDITHRMLYEQKLEMQNLELKKANAELDRFVYSSSHDLRAPLASILGLINLSLMSNQVEEKDVYIGMIEKSVNRLDRFIQDIIHYSRNSRLEIEHNEINFEQLINDTIEKLSYMDEIEKVDIACQYQLKAPFVSDASRISVILSNLIGNAVRYRSRSVDQSFVKVRVQADIQQMTLEVEDNGIGISPEYQNKVFDMFFKASHENHGSGLGLYIVKETINVLNGNITLTSATRLGTTFTVTLPNMQP